ncbi:Smr/MutS family protein [Rudanella lutea]|uniref:Smr/MutS family protein n=1 Tax=Rudanella lutea TaxID=451374 RepID=UPI000379C3C2|nr:Smr/MutS family protein [Rudanella lutea]
MNIGDKVRMIRAKEQGVVTRFLSGNQVEIEIEDGFRIPVLRSELVVVSPLEAERLLRPSGNAQPPRPTGPVILANQGIYMAFVAQNDREFAVHLVNNTDWDMPYTLAEERGTTLNGLQSGVLKPRSSAKLNDYYSFSTLDSWPTFLFQGLWFRAAKVSFRSPLVKRLKCRAQTFHASKKTVPVLNQQGHLYQLDADEKEAPAEAPMPLPTVPLSPQELKEEMLKAKNNPAIPPSFERPSSVVDLHIDVLLPKGPGGRQPGELLDLQLETFEKLLENAIATGMSEITFIHGVGTGTLRTELHRRLGRHPHVKYFEDAQKQKFGYGATKVFIK